MLVGRQRPFGARNDPQGKRGEGRSVVRVQDEMSVRCHHSKSDGSGNLACGTCNIPRIERRLNASVPDRPASAITVGRTFLLSFGPCIIELGSIHMYKSQPVSELATVSPEETLAR
jgi:hypothetical protein